MMDSQLIRIAASLSALSGLIAGLHAAGQEPLPEPNSTNNIAQSAMGVI
jgi:hypothetical protein